jgi:hypothetical protein
MLYASRPFDLCAYVGQLSPDLGYAILTATIVEEQLEVLLLTHLKLDEEGVANLFGDNKPYSTFGRKIWKAHIGHALIDDKARDDLLVIKDIRNEFAHTRKRRDFKSVSIRALAEKFPDCPPEFEARHLFDERVERAIKIIQAKTDAIIFEEATSR